MSAPIDSITFSVIWGGLLAAAAEMGVTLSRTAYSVAVREGSDFSTGIFDHEGNMVAQGDYSPGHLGSMAFTVRRMLQDYPKETLSPGDAILCNDPGIGSGHLPDMFMISPVFLHDDLIGYAVNIAHQIDIGGSGAGSQTIVGIDDNYQEGLRFLPTRCYHKGEPVRDIFRLIAANVRVPEVLGDMRAQYAANNTGAQRLIQLAETYGAAMLKAATAEIIRRSAAEMRAAINRLPKGTYRFADRMDDVGPGTDPVEARVAVTIGDGRIVVDWDGSGPQRASGMNSYFHYTFAYSIAAVKSVTLPTTPQNHGIISTMELRAPPGCFFNPIHPAPCGGRAVVSHRIFEVVLGALAQVAPDKAIAATSHFFNPNMGGVNPRNGRPFICWESIIGGLGARSVKDGQEAYCSPWNGTNVPVEVQEIMNPVMIDRVELIADSAGPGQFRGGTGLRKDLRLLADNVSFYNLGDRAIYPPYGLHGGMPGKLGQTLLNPGTRKARELHSKGVYKLRLNDVISWRTSGAGGSGRPWKRDVEAVRRDAIAGLVTVAGARSDYGVVLNPKTLAADKAATIRARAAMIKASARRKGPAAPSKARARVPA